jgi:hypothetical protein
MAELPSPSPDVSPDPTPEASPEPSAEPSVEPSVVPSAAPSPMASPSAAAPSPSPSLTTPTPSPASPPTLNEEVYTAKRIDWWGANVPTVTEEQLRNMYFWDGNRSYSYYLGEYIEAPESITMFIVDVTAIIAVIFGETPGISCYKGNGAPILDTSKIRLSRGTYILESWGNREFMYILDINPVSEDSVIVFVP